MEPHSRDGLCGPLSTMSRVLSLETTASLNAAACLSGILYSWTRRRENRHWDFGRAASFNPRRECEFVTTESVSHVAVRIAVATAFTVADQPPEVDVHRLVKHR